MRVGPSRADRWGEDPKTLTPREWQARYGAVVADRRIYVLQQLVGNLRA